MRYSPRKITDDLETRFLILKDEYNLRVFESVLKIMNFLVHKR
jgi:hypothetical protein